jgi:hypothetical protein
MPHGYVPTSRKKTAREKAPEVPRYNTHPAQDEMLGTSASVEGCCCALTNSKEGNTMKKLLLASACAVVGFAFVAPASSQTTEFYVVQDVKTKKCTIVDRKPTTTTEMTIMGDGAVFKTRTEAETGMKSYKVCTTN